MQKNYTIPVITALCVTAFIANSTVHAEAIPPIDCMIEPNIVVDVSSPVSGVVDAIRVDRSDEVKKGQIIATINSDVEKVNLKISKEKLKLHNAEFERALELYEKKVITQTEKDKSDNEKKLSELNLEHAKVNLRQRQVKSPIDGIVVKRYFAPGEFVENDPIIKLAQLDPLKVEVISLVSNYGQIIKGMKAKIEPEFGNYDNLIAEVVVVDKVIDAASGTFGVRLKLPNKGNKIPSGLKCRVHFLPGEKTTEAPVVSSLNNQR
jgi:RND family efflux transporter MFP subunit